jgi:quercetin dioxygenase-like cupin family protein
MEDPHSSRLRPQPESRFAAPQHAFDLGAAAAKLKQEFHAGEQSHRQITLYKQDSTTVALFVFGPAARLPSHRARGIVTIQVLRGHLEITAEGQAHTLHPGNLLVLGPGVEHDLVAHEESEMLLTVHLGAATPSRT